MRPITRWLGTMRFAALDRAYDRIDGHAAETETPPPTPVRRRRSLLGRAA